MSEELYGQPATEAAHGYVPMGEPVPAPKTEDAYGPNELHEAAEDLVKRREDEEVERPITERNYTYVSGEKQGERVAENETLSLERAARDLTNIRDQEAQDIQTKVDSIIANEADSLRAGEPIDPNATPQPEGPQIEAQPEPQPENPGVDPELWQALQNPKIRQPIEALVQQTQAQITQLEQTQQRYAQAIQNAVDAAGMTLFANFPELRGLNSAQLPIALDQIHKQNPTRYMEIRAHLDQVQAIDNAAQQARQQAAQMAQARWQEWIAQQDVNFLTKAPEITDPEVRDKLAKSAVRTLENAGFTRDDIASAWNGMASISLRDHRAQLLLMKAAKYDESQLAVVDKRQRPVPPVQRPGVGRDRSDIDSIELAGLERRLANTGNLRDATNLLLARRAARR